MTDFADQLMVRYLDPANVAALLMPPADTTRQRIRALLAGVYQPQLLTVEAVDEVSVRATRFQVPIVEPVTVRGTWDRVIPPPAERALATVELPSLAQTFWLDMMLDAVVGVRVSTSAALLDAVGSEDVSGLSQPDFVARFAFLDLPGLMRAAGVGTYQELQADFPRLYKLHYADPPAYDPDDPAAVRSYRLRVSALFFPTLDLAGALRQLGRTRRAVDAAMPRVDEYEGGDLLSASAWLAVFPAGAVGAGTPSPAEITALLGADRFVAAFETV
ncbi:MAG TPA: hypothetical protein VMU51_22670 [Mycobacteriales bacterium]|nr:hypothetical protein [Mycobacteriales bacterium]